MDLFECVVNTLGVSISQYNNDPQDFWLRLCLGIYLCYELILGLHAPLMEIIDPSPSQTYWYLVSQMYWILTVSIAQVYSIH